jgi:hypothetical protein
MSEPEFLNFLGPQASFPHAESTPCEKQFRRGIDSRERGREEPRTKSITASKINILLDMGA